jgi:putative chitinase
MIPARELAEILGCPLRRGEKWVVPLNAAMTRYDIDTPLRQAAFLAQVGHESGRLVYVREIWNPARCPWQARYEGRADLAQL